MTKRSRTVDDITRRLASAGWSYGYCAGFDGDGDWKWIADASRGDHHLKATGAALEEACRLWSTAS
jgi:hypothetical protein